MDWAREFIYPSWDHQVREFEMHRDDPARALHWQMRTGKTKAMVDLACYLYATGKIDGVLILAPNNVHANWTRIQLWEHHWLGVEFDAMAWSTAASKSVSYEQKFGELLACKGLAWYAVNAEATVLKQQRPFLQAFMKRRRFMLIVDETHEWRRPGSKRSMYLRNRVAPKAVVRRNLSGTMIDNNPFHAYAQFEILQKGALGFTRYGDFEKHFGVWEKDTIYIAGGRQREVPKLVEFRRLEELRARMAELTSYVYRDECDDLPDLVPGTAEFELVGQQKRVYNDLARGAMLKLDTGELIDTNPDTGVITKLQTIRTGYIKDEDGEVHWLVPPEESPAIQHLLEEIRRTPGKVLVWCRFREEIETLCRVLKRAGIVALHYYGGTSKVDRPKHEDRFQKDPRVKALIAQPKACGQGLDFSAGEHIIWFSHTHGDLIGRRQADERCTKVGGRKIAVTDMVGRGTVDHKILSDQDHKVETTDFLTGDGLREYLRIVA